MKRLFVAIKIIPDENFLSIYHSLRNNLKADLIKWVEPDKMHITLKFLGETHEKEIPKVKQLLQDFTLTHSEFEIVFDKVGIFGSSYNPRVVWFGMEDNEKIRNLGEDLLNYFHENGYRQDRQNFIPHLTVGRIKKLENKNFFQKQIDKAKEQFLQTFKVSEIILFQSRLTPQGPIYTELGKYNLKGN